MVLIWNMLAGGDSEYCAVLVALNSVFQIVMYSPLAYLFLRVIPGWFGAEGASVYIGMGDIARSVLIFLGIPLAAGVITRLVLVRRRGVEWYDTQLMPRLGPTAIIGLLFTIIVMFSMQGDKILAAPPRRVAGGDPAGRLFPVDVLHIFRYLALAQIPL